VKTTGQNNCRYCVFYFTRCVHGYVLPSDALTALVAEILRKLVWQ